MTRSAQATLWLGVIAVVLLSVNLRPGATSVGPVLAEVRVGLGMGSALAGVLTALPGMAFAVFGALAVSLGLRLGLAGAIAAGAVASAIGLLARSLASSVPVFLAFTVLAFAGMAIGNVLVPAYVKRHYPNRLASLMSGYTVGLALGATLASLVSAPLSQGTPEGWRTSLGVWGVAAALAAVPWVALAVLERRRHARHPAGGRPSGSVLGVVGSRKAIALATFFGMQAMQAYVQFGWIAQMYRDGGLDAAQAGAMASLIAAFGIPAGFVMPSLAARLADPRPVVWALGAFLLVGYGGILIAPTALPVLWAICLGMSSFAFPFAMALITVRTRDHHVTTQLSGFTQSVGYVFSALGPLLVGVLSEATGGWVAPLWFLLGSAVVFTAAGLVAAAPGYVDDELSRG